MAGSLSGMDFLEAMATIAADLDRDFCRRLLLAAESEFLAAFWESKKNPSES
jgi:hypothetical protein